MKRKIVSEPDPLMIHILPDQWVCARHLTGPVILVLGKRAAVTGCIIDDLRGLEAESPSAFCYNVIWQMSGALPDPETCQMVGNSWMELPSQRT